MVVIRWLLIRSRHVDGFQAIHTRMHFQASINAKQSNYLAFCRVVVQQAHQLGPRLLARAGPDNLVRPLRANQFRQGQLTNTASIQ